jgi:WD40 repeat protein
LIQRNAQLGDNENRTRVSSLTTGEQKAIQFGSYARVCTAAGILIMENGNGQADVYDLKTFEKHAQLTFRCHISTWTFSADGQRLLILSANQIAYIFDTQVLAKSQPATAVAAAQ